MTGSDNKMTKMCKSYKGKEGVDGQNHPCSKKTRQIKEESAKKNARQKERKFWKEQNKKPEKKV